MRVAAAAVALAAALAAGCGSSGSEANSGAAKAPADAPAFVSLRTDRSSAQWKQTLKLAAKFPGLAGRLGQLERYKGAVGPEVDLVWLDLGRSGDDVVALTKPRNLAKLKTLVDRETPTYSTLSGGWVVIGNRAALDRYKRRIKDGTLDGEKAFKDGFGKLDPAAAVRVWTRGAAVQAALDRGLVRNGAAPRITHDAGDLRALAADAKAQPSGVGFRAFGLIDPKPKTTTFSPSLQDAFPAGAALYVATAGLDRPTRLVLRMVGDSKPSFDGQLAQVESVLGVSLKGDVYPLLKGESAVAVYPGGGVPRILFVQKVSDDAKAESLLGRVGAVAQLSGSARVTPVRIGGTSAQKLTFKGSNVVVYDGVAHGHLFVADTAELARQAATGAGAKLSSDPLFRRAHAAASMPSKVAAFAYGDLRHGLPFVFSLARTSGSAVPPAAIANTKPVETTVVYLVPDDDGLRMSGFTTIK